MNLQKELISPNILTIAAWHSICIALWFFPFFIGKAPAENYSITLLNQYTLFSCSPFVASVLQYILLSLFGILINKALDKLKLLSSHNFLFYFIFLFLISITHYAHYLSNTSIAFFFILIAFYQLLRMFQSEAVFRSFNSMLFLGIAILFNIEFIWFIPFFWLIFIQMRAFTQYTFFSSIFGFALVSFTIFSICYITDNYNILQDYFRIPKTIPFFNFQNLTLKIVDIVFFFLFGIYLCIYVFNSFIHRLELNVATRVYYTFSILLLFYTILVYLINSTYFIHICLPILCLISFFATLFYNFKQNKFTNILLLSFLILGFTYQILNLILL